jgi:hypothetical protein
MNYMLFSGFRFRFWAASWMVGTTARSRMEINVLLWHGIMDRIGIFRAQGGWNVTVYYDLYKTTLGGYKRQKQGIE